MLARVSAALAISIGLAVSAGGAGAQTASGECRFIQSRKERNACYERETAAKAAAKAAQKSGSAGMGDAIDALKLENDRLNKRLQGICRGC